MPKFLEKKLKKQYGDNPSAVYGTMNKLEFMHGNKETAKGHAAEKKHHEDTNSITGQRSHRGSSKKTKAVSKMKLFAKNLKKKGSY